MGLIVRFQGGPRAGELAEFGREVELVRFGRAPDRCDVVFPESARNVGREHFAVERVLRGWRLVLDGRSPVWVEGRLAHDGQSLELPCELVVGADGPRLVLESTDAHSLVTTEGAMLPMPGPHTRLERLNERLRRHRALAIAGAVVLATAVAWIGYEARASAKSVEHKLAELDGEQSAKLRSSMERFAAEHPPTSATAEMLERARASVFVVLALRPERDPEPIGTAFAIEGGRAATNAHVAREVLRRQATRYRVVLRASTTTPRDFDVTDALVHPGYDAFLALMDEYRVLDPLTGDALGFVPACDVAVLVVGDSERAEFPAPLECASLDVERALHPGATVCSIGFPAEGLLGHGADLTRPAATTQSGHVTRITDFFQGEAVGDDALLVHHDLPGVGGASGSPVLDELGHVVALHSAGSFSFVPRFDLNAGGMLRNAQGEAALQRIPTTGYFFAQRADLLRELLDGGAIAKHDARIAAWRARFEELRARGHGFLRDHFAEQMAGYLKREIEASQLVVRAIPEVAERALVLGAGQIQTDALLDGELQAGIYLATGVAATPRAIGLAIVDPSGQTIAGQGPLGASFVAFRLAAPGKVHVLLARPAAESVEDRVDVRIVRMETGR